MITDYYNIQCVASRQSNYSLNNDINMTDKYILSKMIKKIVQGLSNSEFEDYLTRHLF